MNLIAHIRAANKDLVPTHRCAICQDHVKRRPFEDRRDWLRRKTCEKPGCKLAMDTEKTKNASKAPKPNPRPPLIFPASKECPICEIGQGTFFRRDGERNRNWLDRKTCSTEHQYVLQGQTRSEKYHKDEAVREKKPVDYGAGFASQNIPDPGDGGPIRLSKPLAHTAGGVGRYL